MLAPEQKAQLLEWTRLAYVAENSVRKLHGVESPSNNIFVRKPQKNRRN